MSHDGFSVRHGFFVPFGSAVAAMGLIHMPFGAMDLVAALRAGCAPRYQ